MHWLRRFLGTVAFLVEAGWLMAQPQQSPIGDWQHQLNQAASDSSRVRLCLTIAQYYYNKTQFDSLYPYVHRGLRLLSNSPSHTYAGELYFLLSRYYRYKGQHKKGIPFGQQAIQHALQSHNSKRAAELQYYLAVLYSDAGYLSKAVDQIRANLHFLQTHEDGPTRAANYVLIINLFQEMNNTTMVRSYWKKYIALDKRTWPAEDKMLFHGNTGEVLEKEGKLKEAEYHFRKAIFYAYQAPNPDLSVAASLEYLGINLRKQGRYPQAIEVLQQGFTRAKSITNLGTMSAIEREMAITYLAFKRPREAIREARYALRLSRQHKNRDGIMASLKTLGTILEAQGQYPQALQCYREEKLLQEEKFTENYLQKVAQLEAQFDAETKENTIKLLQQNAQINRLSELRQREQLASARQTQLGGLLLISLLSLVVGLTIYNLRKSRRNNALLTEQKTLLQQTASQLAETNSIKDKLLSLIGHDLRSPVATMKNSLRQIREPNQPQTQLASLMERLDKQVDNVLALLTNLLDWSMIQLNGTQTPLKPVFLFEIVNNVLSQASDQIEQKQLIVINQVDRSHVALTNPYQLEGVVRNLLGNAIKFTPVGGYIRLVSYRKADRVELQVHDSGLGMSAEQLAALFTTPSIRPGTQGEKGTGLGLRLCRDMLERQGGHLLIESREGRGTSVRARLVAAETNAVR